MSGDALTVASISQALKALAGNAAFAMFFASGFRVEDDFTGSSVDAGKWIASAGVTLVSGGETNANGVCKVLTAGAGTYSILTEQIHGIGTGDFYFGARVRVPTIGGGSVQVGFVAGTQPFLRVYFESAPGASANWSTYYNNFYVPTSVAVGSTYHLFEFQRSGNALAFRIDGTQVDSRDVTGLSIIDGQQAGISITWATSDTEVRADRIRAWANC